MEEKQTSYKEMRISWASDLLLRTADKARASGTDQTI